MSYVNIIKDNDFSMDNYARITTPILRKMFIHNLSYLGIMRNIETLGEEILTYIKVEFPTLYTELLKYVINSEYTQFSCLQGMLSMQGRIYISDVIRMYIDKPYLRTNVFDALYKAQKALGKIVVDTRTLDVAVRFKMGNAISDTELRNIMRLGLEGDEKKVESRLYQKAKRVRELLDEQERDLSDETSKQLEDAILRLQRIYGKKVV